jgi:hypothetical protein
MQTDDSVIWKDFGRQIATVHRFDKGNIDTGPEQPHPLPLREKERRVNLRKSTSPIPHKSTLRC